MPKTYPVRNSFNAGEVAELVAFRDDVQKYSSACLTLENAVPLVEGGAKKMPGTHFAGSTARGGAMFKASISGTTMVVTEMEYGSLRVGDTVLGPGVTPGTVITVAETPGSPDVPVYTTTSQSLNAASYIGTGDWEYVGTQNRLHFQPVVTNLADLVFSNFGFSIPAGATILGIEVSTLNISQAPTIGTVSQVALWSAGAPMGTIKTPATPFTTSLVTAAYGSPSDLWGATLTPSIVNDPGFGFAVAVDQPQGVRLFVGQPFTMKITYRYQSGIIPGTPPTPIHGVGSYTVNNSQTVAGELMQTPANGKSRLVPFQFSTAQGAVLEFSKGIVRIWEGATQGDWALGLALQVPPAGSDYAPSTSYLPGSIALAGPAAGCTFYTMLTGPIRWVPDTSQGVLTFASPYGTSNAGTVPITFSVNTADTLVVGQVGSTPNMGINIALANTTPSNNNAAAIQIGLRALGSLNSPANNFIDLSGWTVTPDPIYEATPWITAPSGPAGQPFAPGTPSVIAKCVTANQFDEFPLLFDGSFNGAFWQQVIVPAGEPIELTTPYAEEDLFALDCSTQSADVLWVFHSKYPPAVIERLSANSWAYSTSLPGQQPGEPPYRGTLGVVSTGYSALGQSITGITKANPCVVTMAATGTVFADGSRVYINLVGGMVELNQGEFLVSNPTLNGDGTFSISLVDPDTGTPVDSSGFLAYVSGGFVVQVVALFSQAGDYPACGTLYQQRLMVGGSDNNPTQFNGSVEGDYPDFITDPNSDDFAIQFRLVSNQVNRLLNMIGTPNSLLIGTSGGVWVVDGSTGSSLSQTNVNASVQTSMGVSALQPQLVNASAIFVSRSQRIVTFLVFSFASNQWESNDLTRLNRNITLGPSEAESGIAQTAFQVEPYPIYWAVRNDGQLIGLVFNTQDQVFAWFRVNMLPQGGFVESIAIITGSGQEDQIAVVVKRTVNGVAQRFVEYFMPQELFGQLSNAWFVNCGNQLNLGPTVAISSITQANPPVVTAANHGFSNGDTVQIADVQGMTEVNQGPAQAYTVAGATTNSFELAGMDTTAFSPYTGGGLVKRVANQVTGMNYLLGNTVVAVGDGAVILEPTVVTSDTIAFPTYANLITIGIPYRATVQPTNPVLSSQGATTRGMPQKLNRVTLSLYQAMGGQYGQDLDHMYDLDYGPGAQARVPQMSTFEVTDDMDCDWSEQSTFFVTQDDPLPFTLRGIVFRMSANQD